MYIAACAGFWYNMASFPGKDPGLETSPGLAGTVSQYSELARPRNIIEDDHLFPSTTSGIPEGEYDK